MTPHRSILILALGLTVLATPATAQQPLRPGAHIRLSAPNLGPEREEATVVAVSTDTVVVRLSHRDTPDCPRWNPCARSAGVLPDSLRDRNYTLPTATIESLEVRVPGGHRTGGGLKVGLLAGVAVGAVLGLASGDDHCGPGGWCILQFSAGEKAMYLGATGGLLGLIVGAAIGSVLPGEMWQPAPGWSVAPQLGTSGGHSTIGLSLRIP